MQIYDNATCVLNVLPHCSDFHRYGNQLGEQKRVNKNSIKFHMDEYIGFYLLIIYNKYYTLTITLYVQYESRYNVKGL